jgi:hypothetical protein
MARIAVAPAAAVVLLLAAQEPTFHDAAGRMVGRERTDANGVTTGRYNPACSSDGKPFGANTSGDSGHGTADTRTKGGQPLASAHPRSGPRGSR